MGCCHSAANKRESSTLKAQYSWDCKDRPDPARFIISGQEEGIVGRVPGEIAGEQFLIQNCKGTTILLYDHSATITVDDCIDCVIFIGPCKGSVFLRDCSGCRCIVAAQQFRVRGCHRCQVHLLCPTQPIIESSSDMAFGCFQCSYPDLPDQFKSAGLSVYCNQWGQIHDFTSSTETRHWTLVSAETSPFIVVPESDRLASVAVSYATKDSVVPLTVGQKQRPSGEVCLVTFFENEKAGENPLLFIRQLQEQQPPLTLVQTIEAKLETHEATRLFADDAASTSKALKGRAIFLEVCGERAVEVCRRLALGRGANVYVSHTLQQAEADIEAFENYMAMRMTT